RKDMAAFNALPLADRARLASESWSIHTTGFREIMQQIFAVRVDDAFFGDKIRMRHQRVRRAVAERNVEPECVFWICTRGTLPRAFHPGGNGRWKDTLLIGPIVPATTRQIQQWATAFAGLTRSSKWQFRRNLMDGYG